MKTAEIVKALPKDKLVSMVVPIWACPTIPYPFVKNGMRCLGFYYYPLVKKDDTKRIQAPIIQIVTTFPEGNIISIVSSPYFLAAPKESTTLLGTYPNKYMRDLTLEQCNELYEQYYNACDNFFQQGEEAWETVFDKIKEEGMEHFYSLFLHGASCANQKEAIGTGLLDEHVKELLNEGINISLYDRLPAKSKHLIHDIQGFFSNPVFKNQKTQITNIIRDYQRGQYSIAVIGEFSRGKTTFLNKLLGIDYLPIGDLPTTAVIKKIVKSEKSLAIFVDKNHQMQQFEPTLNNLEKYLADADGRDPEGVLQICTPIEWLGNNRIFFYDTPGAGDVIGKRADAVREVINHCDCTVMAISAQTACSLTEIEFLKANVVMKAMPNAVVLITKLDTVKQDERNSVVEYIKQKLSNIVPRLTYWIADEIDGIAPGTVSALGIPAIRKQIVKMHSSENELVLAREHQLYARLGLVLKSAESVIKLLEQTERMTEKQKKDAIRKLEHNKTSLDISLLEIGEKCHSLEFVAFKKIQIDLQGYKKELLKDLLFSLKRSPSPKDWAEVDFPYMTEKHLKGIVNGLERKVLTIVMQDKAIILNDAKQKISINTGLNIDFPGFECAKPLTELDFKPENIEKTRLISRCITIVSLPVALCLLGPMATLATGGLGLGSEFFLKNKIDAQKVKLEESLQEKLDAIFASIEQHIKEYLGQCYNDIITTLKADSNDVINNAISRLEEAKSTLGNEYKASIGLRNKLTDFANQISSLD